MLLLGYGLTDRIEPRSTQEADIQRDTPYSRLRVVWEQRLALLLNPLAILNDLPCSGRA